MKPINRSPSTAPWREWFSDDPHTAPMIELPAWGVMWAVAVAIFGLCKILALTAANPDRCWRRAAFLFAWPVMVRTLF